MSKHETTFRIWVGGTITVFWAVSFVADLFLLEYDPPSSVGALMLLVAGALFSEGVVKQVRRPLEERNGK